MKFRQIIFIGIFIGMLTSIAGAAISRTQALEGFVTAEAFYKQGEFAQAASAYEEILTAGGESGAEHRPGRSGNHGQAAAKR